MGWLMCWGWVSRGTLPQQRHCNLNFASFAAQYFINYIFQQPWLPPAAPTNTRGTARTHIFQSMLNACGGRKQAGIFSISLLTADKHRLTQITAIMDFNFDNTVEI